MLILNAAQSAYLLSLTLTKCYTACGLFISRNALGYLFHILLIMGHQKCRKTCYKYLTFCSLLFIASLHNRLLRHFPTKSARKIMRSRTLDLFYCAFFNLYVNLFPPSKTLIYLLVSININLGHCQ